jgi:16S rRNA (adenine1518-N6/adenine1519-N6)-dimethyltransferase
LQDPHIIRRIVAALDPRPEQHLVEIGPGLGALTTALMERIDHLEVVEIDRDLVARLRVLFLEKPGLRIHQADALRFDFAALRQGDSPAQGIPPRLRLVGNLPYNISTPLLFHLLAQEEAIQDMHFMLQQEVVERMAAAAGSPAYGRLSVMVQWHCQVEKLFTVRAQAFTPPPQVTSAVIRLNVRKPPLCLLDQRSFGQLVARTFSQRRKTLRNSLRGWLDETAILAAGVDPGARPETLDVAAFARLANVFHAARK